MLSESSECVANGFFAAVLAWRLALLDDSCFVVVDLRRGLRGLSEWGFLDRDREGSVERLWVPIILDMVCSTEDKMLGEAEETVVLVKGCGRQDSPKGVSKARDGREVGTVLSIQRHTRQRAFQALTFHTSSSLTKLL